MAALVSFQGKAKDGQVSAYGLFRAGKDTMQIAELLGISEAVASRRVFIGRCKFKKLAMGFEPRSTRRPGRPKKVSSA